MTACLLVAQKACLTCIYATFHLASCRQLSVALHGALYPFPPDGLSLPSGKPTASRPQQRKLQGETNHKTSRVHSQLGLGNPGSGMPGSFWTAYIITRCPDLREIQKAIRRILSLAKRWKVYPKYNEVGYSSLELCTDSNSRQER